jgi:hypothetical protein
LPRRFRKGIFRKGMNMRVVSGVRQLFRDPVEAYHKAVSQWYERNDPDDAPHNYVPDANWRERLGVTGDDRERVNRLCRSIEATLTAKGIRPGPESYLFWNDGDPALLQAIWRLIIRVHAAKVIETSVTSRIILEGLTDRGVTCGASTSRRSGAGRAP